MNEENEGMTPEELKEYKRVRNAEYNKKWRQRMKEGGDIINKGKKEKRESLKAIKVKKEEVIKYDLTKATELPVASKVVKSETTKRKYRTFIKGFYRRYSGGKELEEDSDIILKINEEPYNGLNVSRQFKGIIMDNIEDIKGNENYVKELYSIFRGVRGFTEIAKILYPYLQKYKELYMVNRSKIEATEEDLRRIDFENNEEYEENINKLENIADKVIYSYMMKIKGRVGDLRMCKIAKGKEDIEDEGYNWIYDNKMYINNTKNKKKNIIELPESLNFWNSISEGYILGRLIPSGTYSQQIQRIFLKVYGKTYSANNIRHLYATYINEKGASLEERQATAKQSGHSVIEQLSYVYKI
jgi:hypothetical protein